MYLALDIDEIKLINKSALARTTGIAKGTICRVLNGQQACSRMMAYVITKTINKNAEIEDYFKLID